MTSLARFTVRAVLALSLSATVAQAQLIHFTASLEGAQEVPPVTTPATGFGCFTMDTNANTLSYYIEFSGLTAAETAAHIHGFAPPGTPAGILFDLPPGSPKVGTINYVEAQEANIAAGLTYVNVHSANFAAGEIRGQIVQAPQPTTFCHGDGTGASCPCANDSPTPASGCRNSTGSGATLTATGFASLACDSLVLSASSMPNTTAIFFQGTSQVAGGLGVAFGDGLRCAGGTVVRLGQRTNTGGASELPSGGSPLLSVQSLVTAPGTRTYQVWYADTPGLCGATGFNFTNAVQVTWVL